jgi:hypothetical protein
MFSDLHHLLPVLGIRGEQKNRITKKIKKKNNQKKGTEKKPN